MENCYDKLLYRTMTCCRIISKTGPKSQCYGGSMLLPTLPRNDAADKWVGWSIELTDVSNELLISHYSVSAEN